MKIAIMPDGTRVSIENANYRVDGSNVIFRQVDGAETVYRAENEAGAAVVLAAMDVFAASGLVISADPIASGGGFTWTLIEPAVATLGVSDFFVISGTGFAGSGINYLKWFQGVTAGPSVPDSYFFFTGDTTITTGAGIMFEAAGVWTLYYSTDGGGTWTTTALTVTVS